MSLASARVGAHSSSVRSAAPRRATPAVPRCRADEPVADDHQHVSEAVVLQLGQHADLHPQIDAEAGGENTFAANPILSARASFRPFPSSASPPWIRAP